MAKKDKRQRLLGDLRTKRNACPPALAEEALDEWGFTPGRTKGNTQVWTCPGVTPLTLHRPHQKDMDPGAVAQVIRAIESVKLLREQEKTNRQSPTEEDEGD